MWRKNLGTGEECGVRTSLKDVDWLSSHKALMRVHLGRWTDSNPAKLELSFASSPEHVYAGPDFVITGYFVLS
jgi:hypothetical protein